MLEEYAQGDPDPTPPPMPRKPRSLRKSSRSKDGVIYQLQQIASNKEADHNVKFSALAKKNDVLTDKAKLPGLIKDKQEITGSVTNVNLNREVSKDEAREFVKALKDVDLDVEDAA